VQGPCFRLLYPAEFYTADLSQTTVSGHAVASSIWPLPGKGGCVCGEVIVLRSSHARCCYAPRLRALRSALQSPIRGLLEARVRTVNSFRRWIARILLIPPPAITVATMSLTCANSRKEQIISVSVSSLTITAAGCHPECRLHVRTCTRAFACALSKSLISSVLSALGIVRCATLR